MCIGAFLTHLSPGVGSVCMCQQVVESIYSAVPVGKHDSHLRNITQLEEKCLFQRMGSKDYSCKRFFFWGARVLCEAGSSVRGCVGTGVVVRDRV